MTDGLAPLTAKADLGQSIPGHTGGESRDNDPYEYPESGTVPFLAYPDGERPPQVKSETGLIPASAVNPPPEAEGGSASPLAPSAPAGPLGPRPPRLGVYGRLGLLRVSTGLELALAAIVAIILTLGSYRGGGGGPAGRGGKGRGWNW